MVRGTIEITQILETEQEAMEWLLGYEEIRGRGLQNSWKSNGNENTVS